MDEFILEELRKDGALETTTLPQLLQEPTQANILAANLEMQRQLILMRDKLRKVMLAVQERFQENERILVEMCSNKSSGRSFKGAYQMGRSFYYVGSMYFRDRNLRNCPNNPDYLQRKDQNEIFPIDWELRSAHRWTDLDRDRLYRGAKDQVCEFLTLGKTYPKNKKFHSLDLETKVHLLDQPLGELFERVDPKFQIDWNEISAHNLLYRHCPTSSEGYWETYMKPCINRDNFSDEELRNLIQIAEKYNYQNWQAVAKELGTDRSDLQCFLYYTYYCKKFKPLSQRRWDKKNDARLIKIVKANTFNDVINWNAVYAHFPNIVRLTVKNRYLIALDPQHKRGFFTPEEDILLLAAYEEFNGNFKYIPKTLFPNRTIEQLRAHYKQVLSRRNIIRPWTYEDDTKLMEFVNKNGTSAWHRCSKEIFDGVHSGGSCRSRFTIIEKTLKNHPNLRLEDLKRRNRTHHLKMSVSKENFLQKLQELRAHHKIETKATPRKKRKRVSLTESEANTGENANHMDSDSDSDTNYSFREIALTVKQASSLKNEENSELEEPKKTPVKKRSKKRRKVRKKDKKILYRDRLRTQEIRIYNFVKYSYDFRLSEEKLSLEGPTKFETMVPIMLALGFDVPLDHEFQFPHTYKNMSSSFRFKLRQVSTVALHFIKGQEEKGVEFPLPYGYCLPPNWSTLKAFRCFYILNAQKFHSEDKEEQTMINTLRKAKTIDVIDDNPHVQIFRHRLRSLLLKTVFLSRMRCKGRPHEDALFWFDIAKRNIDFKTLSKPRKYNKKSNETKEIDEEDDDLKSDESSIPELKTEIKPESTEELN